MIGVSEEMVSMCCWGSDYYAPFTPGISGTRDKARRKCTFCHTFWKCVANACPTCGAINLVMALQTHFVVWQTSYRYYNVRSEKTGQAPLQKTFWSLFGAFVVRRTAEMLKKRELVREFLLCLGVNPALHQTCCFVLHGST